jgi:hypothetical protein
VAIAKILGHHPPLAPGLVHIENTLEHAAEFQGFPSRSTRAPFGLRQQELENIPLLITYICGIVTGGAHRLNSLPQSCV